MSEKPAPYFPEPDYTLPRAPRGTALDHATTVRMTIEEHEALLAEAHRQQRSKNSILRQAIVQYLGKGEV